MSVTVTELTDYSDDRGNTIAYAGTVEPSVKIKIMFTGSNNHLVVAENSRLGQLTVEFNCDNGLVQIGSSKGVPAFRAGIRVGQDSQVLIGRNVSMTSICYMSATEGTAISIGNDVMFASDNQVRADDGHPIFDVRTGRRVNVSRSITIGNHVWLARGASVLGGASIGDGSVVGFGSIVTKAIPNNCVAAGVPARVVRRDTVWERPHLSLTEPYYKPDASAVKRSAYWNLTADSPTESSRLHPARLRKAVVRRTRRAFRRLRSLIPNT